MTRDPMTRDPHPKGPAILECPECLHACEPDDDACEACGFRFRPEPPPQAPQANDTRSASRTPQTIHFDPVLRRRYTDAVTVEIGTSAGSRHRVFWMLTNLVIGIAVLSIGVFMAYAMPFGFECGMILFFVGALLILNVYLTSDARYTRVEGPCPNCGAHFHIPIRKRRISRLPSLASRLTTSASGICQKCSQPIRYTGTRFEESTDH